MTNDRSHRQKKRKILYTTAWSYPVGVYNYGLLLSQVFSRLGPSDDEFEKSADKFDREYIQPIHSQKDAA